MSFAPIARIYDRFNNLEQYEEWLDFTLSMVHQQPTVALDLGCGTGWFMQLLSPFCNELIGVDIDDAMLDIAREELSNIDGVTLLQVDMRALSQSVHQVDLITCYADSLCFLENEDDVKQTLGECHRVLSQEGTLLFDVWTPYQLQEGFEGFRYFDQDEDCALLWETEVSDHKLEVTHYLTVYEKNNENDDLFSRRQTQLVERTYPLAWYLQTLSEVGFSSVEVYVDYGTEKYDESIYKEEERWFFVCRKHA